MERIATPKQTLAIIQKYNFAFQKRFGQNFLIDSNILDKIVKSAEVTKEDVVIEIGPGIGSLTQVLAENAKHVVAIEIDKKLIPILQDTLNAYDNISLINEDVLKVSMPEIVEKYNEGKPVKVIANLPYYITTPIIMGLFEQNVPVVSITVMVQKEVADRMQALPGTKDYGALSIAVQYYSEPKVITQVSPACFIPAPKVGSSVIQLKKKNLDFNENQRLFDIVRAAFSQRRKTLMNCLVNDVNLGITKKDILSAFEKLGLDEKVRGETLSLEQYIKLAEYLYN